MGLWRLAGAAAGLVICATGANAATIDIDGAWGNKGGCEWARGKFDSDTAILLRRDQIEGMEFQCNFKSASRGNDGSFSVRAECAQEGEEAEVQITIGPDRNGVRTLTANKGWTFSPVSRCR